MSHGMTLPAPRRAWWPPALTVLLGLSASLYTGYHLLIALSPEDTNHLETPLALAVARQVTEGPGVLYGPFGGRRPLVLIHAPLYYRLAGVGAWPLASLGLDPFLAALTAGRLVALAGFVGSLLVVARLATVDGADRRAGIWAALLVASAAVFGSFPVTVRPDTLAIGFQTAGAWLVLRSIRDRRGRDLVIAYALLALAACAKQHDVFVAITGTIMAILAWRLGRLRLSSLLAAHAAGAAIVVAYYGFEEWLTSGMMSRSVLVLPAAFRKIAPADWAHVGETFFEVGKRSIGLLALGLAASLMIRRRRPCWTDLALWAFLVMELVTTAVLCRGSSGAWVNYAMQSIVFAAILVARSLASLADRPAPRAWAMAVIASSAVLVLADARLVAISARHRIEERTALQSLLADPRIRIESPDGLYFVGYPQHNRTYGRAELAHDEWLYQAYEAVGAAEPRDRWLQAALTNGGVRIVVVPLDGRRTLKHVPGLSRSLPELGYLPLASFGRYRAWTRSDTGDRLVSAGNGPDRASRP